MNFAVKMFEIEEGSFAGGHYRIAVIFKGQIVEEFIEPSAIEAERVLEAAGYKKVSRLGAFLRFIYSND